MYADDLTVWTAAYPVEAMRIPLQTAANIISQWCRQNNMLVSPKTDGIIFTRSSQHHDEMVISCDSLNITLKNYFPDPTGPTKSKHFSLLGVILDPQLTFGKHIDGTLSCKKSIQQLTAIAGSFWGPSSHTLRVLYKGLIESVLLYGTEVWWPLLSETHKEKLRECHRAALRIITGSMKSTVNDLLYLEADVPRLDALAESRVAAYLEKCSRYPANDTRRCARDTVPLLTAPVNSQHLRPVETLMTASRHLLNTEPQKELFEPLISPFETTHSHLVTFGLNNNSPVPFTTLDRSEEANTARRNSCLATITRLRLGGPAVPRSILHDPSRPQRHQGRRVTFGTTSIPPRPMKTYEIWTDASVDGNGIGSGVGLLYEGLTMTHLSATFAGISTCSYRGESLAVEQALSDLVERFTEQPPSKKKRHRILLFTDSYGLVAALANGPLLQRGATEIRIWRLMTRITGLGVSCHLQFIYSHCGLERNESADAAAKQMNDLYRQHPPDYSETWIKDVCRQLRQTIELRLAPQTSPLCPSTHSFNPSTPRSTSTRFTRLRTGESLEIGIGRRRIGLDQSMACRFCSSHLHPQATPASPERRCRLYRHSDPQHCPHPSCHGTRPLANITSLREHWRRLHPTDSLPACFQPNVVDPRRPHPKAARPAAAGPVHGTAFADGTIQCPFCTVRVRPGHLVKCRYRQPGQSSKILFPCPHCDKMAPAQHIVHCSARTPSAPPTTPARLEPTAQDETLFHVVYECPALASLRASTLPWTANVPPDNRIAALAKRLKEEDESILRFLEQGNGQR